MNVTEIIDQVLERTDNIKGSPADYLDRRARLLDYLREIQAEIWWLRDWPWRLSKRAALTVPAADKFVAVPSDFGSLGNSGGVYQDMGNGGDGIRFDLKTESEIIDMRELNQGGDNPHDFALFGQDAATYLTLIQLPPITIDAKIAVWYQPNPPTIDESANVNKIKTIPEKYHQLVIVPGVRYKSRESKSDERWKNAKAEYESGKRWMLVEEARFQGQYRRMPSFFGSRRL